MTEEHSKTTQSKGNATTNDLESEYENMPTPHEWLDAQNTDWEIVYGTIIFLIWLLVIAVILAITSEGLGSTFWSLSTFPLLLLCWHLYERIRKLEFIIYKLDLRFRLRKKLRELGMIMDGEWEIESVVNREPIYKTSLIDFRIPFFSRKKDWKKIYPMGPLEYEVLEYVKKHKSFTPGEIQEPFKIGYAKATRVIDTLYVHGYVDQMAFYWQKGKIRYIGE